MVAVSPETRLPEALDEVSLFFDLLDFCIPLEYAALLRSYSLDLDNELIKVFKAGGFIQYWYVRVVHHVLSGAPDLVQIACSAARAREYSQRTLGSVFPVIGA